MEKIPVSKYLVEEATTLLRLNLEERLALGKLLNVLFSDDVIRSRTESLLGKEKFANMMQAMTELIPLDQRLNTLNDLLEEEPVQGCEPFIPVIPPK